jgi:hypothetical protein
VWLRPSQLPPSASGTYAAVNRSRTRQAPPPSAPLCVVAVRDRVNVASLRRSGEYPRWLGQAVFLGFRFVGLLPRRQRGNHALGHFNATPRSCPLPKVNFDGVVANVVIPAKPVNLVRAQAAINHHKGYVLHERFTCGQVGWFVLFGKHVLSFILAAVQTRLHAPRPCFVACLIPG